MSDFVVKNVGLVPESLIKSYETWLMQYGVSWPKPCDELGLVLLYKNMGEPVSQEDLSEFYSQHGQRYNMQLRHIAESGWHVASGNVRTTRMHYDETMKRDQLKLVSVTGPGTVWNVDKRLTRRGRLGIVDWSELLRLYATHGCAVCGQVKSHYDKGHLDPTKPMELSNIVPMCVECNNYAQSLDIHYKLFDLVARPISMKS